MAFEKSVLVPLSADDTFALITEPDRLGRWQVITARVDLRAGGDFRWTIIPGNSAWGTFTEVDPGRRVVFSWGWEGSSDLPPGASTVIITLELADHLIGSVTFLGTAVGADFDPGGTALEARVAAAAQATLEAWHARGLAGEVKVGPHEMPAGAALGILSIEFLVHAWDFAQATGQPVVVSDQVAQHVLGVANQIITPEARGGGAFADPLEAGPDAGILDRLVAFTGRAV